MLCFCVCCQVGRRCHQEDQVECLLCHLERQYHLVQCLLVGYHQHHLDQCLHRLVECPHHMVICLTEDHRRHLEDLVDHWEDHHHME